MTSTDPPVTVTERHCDRRTVRIGWYGTSIMEHLEGYNAQLVDQSSLPKVGSTVTVEGWHRRGYVHRVHLALQAAWPHVSFDVDNRAEGGATSRDVVRTVRRARAAGARYDVVFVGCGINDVWRGFQGRTAEAVDVDEYAANYTAILKQLTASSRIVACITETPFGPIEGTAPAVIQAMNHQLADYNLIAMKAATDADVLVADVWTPFTAAARSLGSAPAAHHLPTLWSDGVHLSELGDALMLRHVEKLLGERHIIERLLDAPQPNWAKPVRA